MATVSLIDIVLVSLIFIISALPLHLAIKTLNGKTNILKTVFISLASGILVAIINNYIKIFGGLIAFLVLVWIYHEVFRLKWWKSFIVWILQLFFIVLFYLIVLLLGLSININ